jgi:hypothetical protein
MRASKSKTNSVSEKTASSDESQKHGGKPPEKSHSHSGSNRTRRTANQEQRARNERELLDKWRSDVTRSLPLEDPDERLTTSERTSPSEVMDIHIRAGQPLGYAFDEHRHSFELDADLAKVYAPRTALLAHEARVLVATTIGVPISKVGLTALLLLDEVSGKATPSWRIRFECVGANVAAIGELERRLRSLMDLVGSDSDELWQRPANDLLPHDTAAQHTVEAAQRIRTAAGSKTIAADCTVTSKCFADAITVPPKIGARKESDGEPTTRDEPAEVVGYDRLQRLVIVAIDGQRSSTGLSADMEVFGALAQQQAPIPGNKCRVRHELDVSNKGARRKLVKLEVLSNGLLAETPLLVEAPPPNRTKET